MTTRNKWKTAPLLLQDLFDHDPRRPTQNEPADRCLHAYKTNPLLSYIPVLDERPGPGTQWSITCTCSLCRSHLDLAVAFTDGQQPCPNADYPLHHFEHLHDSPATQPHGVLPDGEAYVCTASGCRAAVVAGPDHRSSRQLTLSFLQAKTRMHGGDRCCRCRGIWRTFNQPLPRSIHSCVTLMMPLSQARDRSGAYQNSTNDSC